MATQFNSFLADHSYLLFTIFNLCRYFDDIDKFNLRKTCKTFRLIFPKVIILHKIAHEMASLGYYHLIRRFDVHRILLNIKDITFKPFERRDFEAQILIVEYFKQYTSYSTAELLIPSCFARGNSKLLQYYNDEIKNVALDEHFQCYLSKDLDCMKFYLERTKPNSEKQLYNVAYYLLRKKCFNQYEYLKTNYNIKVDATHLFFPALHNNLDLLKKMELEYDGNKEMAFFHITSGFARSGNFVLFQSYWMKIKDRLSQKNLKTLIEEDICRHGTVPILKLVEKHTIPNYLDCFIKALKNENFEIAKYISTQRKFSFEELFNDNWCKYSCIVIKWLIDNDICKMKYRQSLIETVCADGAIEILQKLCEQVGLKLQISNARVAFTTTSLQILRFAVQNDLKHIIPSMPKICENDNIDAFKYVVESGHWNKSSTKLGFYKTNEIKTFIHNSLLKSKIPTYLRERNCIPLNICDLAVEANCASLLFWAIYNGYSSRNVLKTALEWGNHRIFSWAIFNTDYQILDILTCRELLLNEWAHEIPGYTMLYLLFFILVGAFIGLISISLIGPNPTIILGIVVEIICLSIPFYDWYTNKN